jgi:predicted HNH restriction endonuclease
MKGTTQKKEVKRPENLDKRVFFCNDIRSYNFIHEHDLLWLYLTKKGRTNKFQWNFQFDILNSGRYGGSVAFTKDELDQITKICEFKQGELRRFDWNSRDLSAHSSFISYLYLELIDAVEVANDIANFAYKLHEDKQRRLLINEINNNSYKANEYLEIHIYQERRDGQYELIASHGLNLDILIFKNGKSSIKRRAEGSIIHQLEYSHAQAIRESNPNRQDGILLINYHTKQSEFYATDWNTFCLKIDKRKFTKSGEPINYRYNQAEQLSLDDEKYSDTFSDDIVFSAELDQSIDELDINKKFREGAISQATVNVYERNPQARKKCIEYYGTSCFVCGFNFGEAFGELGKGFIHVHHLKPVSEISKEYEVNPIEDMRPVCPNCHAMIHRRTPLLSIEEIKELYFTRKT